MQNISPDISPPSPPNQITALMPVLHEISRRLETLADPSLLEAQRNLNESFSGVLLDLRLATSKISASRHRSSAIRIWVIATTLILGTALATLAVLTLLRPQWSLTLKDQQRLTLGRLIEDQLPALKPEEQHQLLRLLDRMTRSQHSLTRSGLSAAELTSGSSHLRGGQ